MTIAEAEATRTNTRIGRRPTRGAWWVVFKQELVELWVGGRAINLLILYSLLLGLMTFLLATNSELSLIPPKEMVFLTLLNTISFGVFIGMIVGADGISGERERGTLEVLLLTPASRRQLVLGKLLAALTPWPAAFLISLPALFVTAQGDEVFGQAVLLGVLIGTVLAVAFAGFGLLVSTWSNTNKTSMFICLIVWLLLFLLTQLPGEVQKGDFGYFVQRINPMQATSEFLEKVLVNHRTFWERDEFLRSSVAGVVVVLFLLFAIAAPRLRLDASRARRLRARWGSLSGMALSTFLLVPLVAGPGVALGGPLRQADGQDLAISLDESFLEVKTGDEVTFDTLLENNGSEDSPPVVMAMNIIKLTSTGDVVDPEDWSPERTQYVDFVPAGDQLRHSWTIEAILKGDYMVYLVAVPEPEERSSSHPVSSPGLHLTVGAFQRLNPQGVLPVVIAVPLGVTLALLVLVRLRLRRLGRPGPDEDDERSLRSP
jgi:ABC-type multidrug transport system permease subunit